MPTINPPLSRRRFLQQSFFFSAALALGSRTGVFGAEDFSPEDHHYLMIGDWGYDTTRVGQRAVAQGMKS